MSENILVTSPSGTMTRRELMHDWLDLDDVIWQHQTDPSSNVTTTRWDDTTNQILVEGEVTVHLYLGPLRSFSPGWTWEG